MAGLLFGTLFILLLLNIPIAISLGMASIVALNLGEMPTPPLVVAQRMFTALDSFPFMAIPFFMLAGGLMESGGISRRLINFTRTLVGGVPGGLGVITIVASAFFGAISGSNPATVAAIGGIMIPSMIRAGYPKDFAAAIAAAGGTLGVIIPPSIPMITYGVVAGVSIGALFMAGFIPGIMLALGLTLVVVFYARKLGLKGEQRATFKEFLVAAKDAVLALIMPLIILGGIYGGVFTPTEAASVAVVYAFIVSVFIYREIKFKELGPVLVKAGMNTSVVLLIIATSASFAWLITSARIPAIITQAMLSISENPIVLILLINILLLILGTFLETVSIILLIAPILLPLALQLGIDPILLGIIMVVNTSIGMITPPLAVNLFVACGISNLGIEQISRRIVPFLIMGIIIIMLISNIPQLSLWLPNVLLQ
jgi:C4-dicarboxylate transporter DctM subunit